MSKGISKLTGQPVNKGRKFSDIWKKNIGKANSISHKGLKYSLGTRKKVSEARKGERCHFWKGGISKGFNDLKEKIRRCFEYRQWRSDVFHRDNFTCQECGDNKGGNLEAHHLKLLLTIIKEYNIKTIDEALNCEELWDINNGLTLCKNCHKNLKPIIKIKIKRRKYGR